MNGYEIAAPSDEQAQIILDVAANIINRDNFTIWLNEHLIERP